LDDLREFPRSARRPTGFQLDKLQNGEDADDRKPLSQSINWTENRPSGHLLPTGMHAVRAVFYLDISAADTTKALAILRETLDAIPIVSNEASAKTRTPPASPLAY
jgi:hypothetical protein